MKVLDLFSGLGGWSIAFIEDGHEVDTLDNAYDTTFKMDIRDFHPGHYDVVLASPPCPEFSKLYMPWHPIVPPDMTLMYETFRVIKEAYPDKWVLENVRGAHYYLGPPTCKCGFRYLWGNVYVNIPPIPKGSPGTNRAAQRAKIPYALSRAVCDAITKTP